MKVRGFGVMNEEDKISDIREIRRNLEEQRRSLKFVSDSLELMSDDDSITDEYIDAFVGMYLNDVMMTFISTLGFISDNPEYIFASYRHSKMRVNVLKRLIKGRYGLEVEG